ncbi:MAG: hypothetical protein P8Y61_12245 [Gammaproteobacteria bacterium]|jgi:hypothetical protein
MERYKIKLPERLAGEPDIEPEQLAEANELIARIAIGDRLDFDVTQISANQAEVLINRLTDIWNGDLALERHASEAVQRDTEQQPRFIFRVLLIALAVFAVSLLVANLLDA